MNQVPDKTILQKVNQNLSRTGTSSKTKVAATVRNGEVTLSGVLQYEIHRSPLVKAVTRVPGVRRVVDQLKVEAKKSHYH